MDRRHLACIMDRRHLACIMDRRHLACIMGRRRPACSSFKTLHPKKKSAGGCKPFRRFKMEITISFSWLFSFLPALSSSRLLSSLLPLSVSPCLLLKIGEAFFHL